MSTYNGNGNGARIPDGFYNGYGQPQDGASRLSAILGPDGQPMETSAPAGIKLPPVYTFSSIVNTVSKTYLNRQDEAYSQSRESALAMRRDCWLQALLRERQYPSEQMRWHLDCEDSNLPLHKKFLERMEKIIRRIPRYTQVKRQMLEALWYGRAGVQHSIDWDELDGQRAAIVKSTSPINGDKIAFTWDGTPGVRVYAGAVKDLENAGATIEYSEQGSLLILDKPFWRQRFAIHHHDCVDSDFWEFNQAGAIYGVGIRHWIYWTSWVKNEVESWLVDYMERTGLGLTIYWYDAASKDGEATARKRAKEDGRNTVIVYPRGSEGKDIGPGVERIETSTQGAEVINRMMKYFDDRIERFVIGQTLSGGTEGGGLGGSGVAKLHGDTKYRIIKSDCMNLDESITEEIVQPLARLNDRGAKFRIWMTSNIEEYDPLGKLQAINTAYGMGVSFDANSVRELTGQEKPKEDSEILQKQADMAPPGMFGVDPPDGDVDQDTGASKPTAQQQQPANKPGGNPPRTMPNQPKHFARWNESEHPRDDKGRFAEKEQAVREIMGDFASNHASLGHPAGDAFEIYKSYKSDPSGPYKKWVFPHPEEEGDGYWAQFQSKEDEEEKTRDAWWLNLSKPASEQEGIFFRSGNIPANFNSVNHAEGKNEGGVSAYPEPFPESFAGLEDSQNRFWYVGKGVMVGTGSDDEPLVIPTSEWKKISATQLKRLRKAYGGKPQGMLKGRYGVGSERLTIPEIYQRLEEIAGDEFDQWRGKLEELTESQLRRFYAKVKA